MNYNKIVYITEIHWILDKTDENINFISMRSKFFAVIKYICRLYCHRERERERERERFVDFKDTPALLH